MTGSPKARPESRIPSGPRMAGRSVMFGIMVARCRGVEAVDLTGRVAPAARPPRGRHDRREPPPVVAEQPLEEPGVGEAPPACRPVGRQADGAASGEELLGGPVVHPRSRAPWPRRGGARERWCPGRTSRGRGPWARRTPRGRPRDRDSTTLAARSIAASRPARRRGREAPGAGALGGQQAGGCLAPARQGGVERARLAGSLAMGSRTIETSWARSSAAPVRTPWVEQLVPWGSRKRPIRPAVDFGPTRSHRAVGMRTEPPSSVAVATATATGPAPRAAAEPLLDPLARGRGSPGGASPR